MILEQRSCGVLLHVTSLPGPHGIGDFGPSTRHFVDWLEKAGQKVWQWLPTTPIGPGDSPYQSVSAFAGSPLMVALESLVAAGWLAPPTLPDGGFDGRKVDFGRVQAWRQQQLRAAAAGFADKATPEQRQAFAQWCEEQAYWLEDYSLFMALEQAHGGQPWWLWAAPLRTKEPQACAAARTEHAKEVAYWQFVQWCFDTQLSALKAYANGKGISLVGDLPIFIAHHSADCWARPDLYFLDEHSQPSVVAGVPPDAMAPDGQRWGNPLYRWDRMAAENYAWWTARVRRALGQADVFRIDHFRGFAGYWEIPCANPNARVGQWVPGPGQALFDAIAKALGPLPIIAEDLGLITPDVIALRDGCGFPGMRIAQFGFGDDAEHEFLPHNYVAKSVAYTGTHDNDTALGWWRSGTPRERSFAGAYLRCDERDVHWAMMHAVCMSPANMVVFPLQDVLGLGNEARMNLPGAESGQWTWRFDWNMVGSDSARKLGLMAAASGRAPLALLHLPPKV